MIQGVLIFIQYRFQNAPAASGSCIPSSMDINSRQEDRAIHYKDQCDFQDTATPRVYNVNWVIFCADQTQCCGLQRLRAGSWMELISRRWPSRWREYYRQLHSLGIGGKPLIPTVPQEKYIFLKTSLAKGPGFPGNGNSCKVGMLWTWYRKSGSN